MDLRIYVVQERRATDYKAPKLWKGSSGVAVYITYLRGKAVYDYRISDLFLAINPIRPFHNFRASEIVKGLCTNKVVFQDHILELFLALSS